MRNFVIFVWIEGDGDRIRRQKAFDELLIQMLANTSEQFLLACPLTDETLSPNVPANAIDIGKTIAFSLQIVLQPFKGPRVSLMAPPILCFPCSSCFFQHFRVQCEILA